MKQSKIISTVFAITLLLGITSLAYYGFYEADIKEEHRSIEISVKPTA